VKGVLVTFVFLSVVALIAIVAPARPRPPRLPQAVDSELAPPAAAQASSGPVLSPPLRAPRRFSVVGLRWRGSGSPTIRLRTRASGGSWTRWLELPGEPDGAPDPGSGEGRSGRGESSPVWVGNADWVQYRLSRPVPGLRLHFVSIDRRGWRPPALRAQAGKPAIEPRSAWDPGGQCPPRTAPQYGNVQVALVHHTVSLNDYQPSDVPSIILGICRFHRNSNGWNDIGYNFLVDRFGTLWEGRAGGVDQPVVGAQARGYNSQSTGIANIGTFDDVPETDAAMRAMAALIRWKLPLTGAATTGSVQVVSAGGSDNRYPAGTKVTLDRVSGHRDVDATDCPGGDLYAQLPVLRRLVGSVRSVRLRTKVDIGLYPPTVVYPQKTVLSGRLTTVTGIPLVGRRLRLQFFGHGSWHSVALARSDPEGGFSLGLSPSVRHDLRVVYPGDLSHLSSTSTRLTLQVRPRIELRRSVSRARVGRTPTLSGSIRPAKARLLLTVRRKSGRRTVRVARIALHPAQGRFRKSFRLRARGLYGFRVTFGGDGANASAGSQTLHVRAL
jgi:hypothetical protein